MPKCEFCPHFKVKVAGASVGWCEIHQCTRKLNDACSDGEIANKEYWGER